MAAILQLNLTGGAANSDPNASLGGTHSSVQVSATAMNNLFDNVSADEALSGDTEYRCVDLTNVGDATAIGVNIWMGTPTSSADTQLDMGIVASPVDSTESVANESSAPATVSFANRTSGAKLSLPNIAAGSYCRVWLRRVVAADATNTSSDAGTISWEYA